MAAFLDKFRFTRKPFRQPKEKEADVSETKKAKEPAAEIHQPASEDTGQAYRVLLRPLVTEKGARLGESGQYVFIVARDATRIAVARAVEKVYGVRPLKVNIARVRGKQIRFGRTRGRQKDWKKALVILPPGKKIRVYEGV